MTERPDLDLAALDALERDLVAAAARTTPGPTPWWQRLTRRRRVVLGTLAAGLVVAGGATATSLISVGDDDPNPSDVPLAWRPAEAVGSKAVTLRAPDREAGGSWGLVSYTNRSGLPCLIAGWVRGAQLGVVRGGTFRPYSDDRAGACGAEGPQSITLAALQVREPTPRTIAYGRVGTDVPRAVLVTPDGEQPLRPAADGAYLVVLEGDVPLSSLRTRPAP